MLRFVQRTVARQLRRNHIHVTSKRTLCESAVPKTALVTGGNRGIGLEACKQLSDTGFKVIMSTRCLDRGTAALQEQCSPEQRENISLLQLDISDPFSISDAVKKLEQDYDNIDVLINNAGTRESFDKDSPKKSISKTLSTNYHGTVGLTHKLLPLLRESRIICLSNRDCALKNLSPELQQEFLRDDLDQNELDNLMLKYQKIAEKGDFEPDAEKHTTEQGWINSYYLMSYVGVNLFCRVLGRTLQKRNEQSNWVGAYCPGHCATDSTEYFGEREPSESAFGIVTLSTMMLSEYTPNGKFWSAFYRSVDLDSVELEIMDLIHPMDTMSWDVLCDEFVSDPKIQSFE